MRSITASGRDERGVSLTVFVTIVSLALFIMAGLVLDGGQQAAAVRRAHAAAAGAARAATDAGTTNRVSGRSGEAAATSAARSYLSRLGVPGAVSVDRGGAVLVETELSVETVFLSLIGIDRLQATGRARSEVFGVR